MISSKIGMKPGARADQQTMQYSQGSSGMNQYAGNLQQPYPNKYQSKSVSLFTKNVSVCFSNCYYITHHLHHLHLHTILTSHYFAI